MEIVSSNENSTLDWRAQYKYIEDIHDGRGYTAGIIGFCSGTGDMLELVEAYTDTEPRQPAGAVPQGAAQGQRHRLAQGSRQAVRAGLEGGRARTRCSRTRRTTSATPSTSTRPSARGSPTGSARSASSSTTTRSSCTARAAATGASAGSAGRRWSTRETPAEGGDETTYLNAFLDARRKVMLGQRGHHDTTRIDTEQRVFLDDGNLDLDPPLVWHVYGDRYEIDGDPPALRTA